jgi:glycosyltransferase involved in cell wall biosynthesis
MTQRTVVLATDTFAPDHNGTATFTKRLAVGLQLQGVEVHVIAPATSRLYGTFREKHDGVPIIVHRLKSSRIPFQPSQRFVSPIGLTSKVKGLLEAISPDLVHIQSHINIGHHAALAAKELGLKLVATNHVDAKSFIENALVLPSFAKNFLAKTLIADSGRVMRICDVVATPSRVATELLTKSTGLAGVQTVSGGVNPALYAGLPLAKLEDRVLTYVGRLDREKHVYVLLEAVAKLPKDFKLDVNIIGGGAQLSELKTLAAQLKIEKRIHFLGELADHEVVEELGRSSAFVMPSTQELLSMATLEAMAAGRPVIAARALALADLVTDGSSGLLFQPDSANDLAKSIQSMFSQSQSAFVAMAKAAKQTALTHSIEITLAKYLELYFGESVEHSKNIQPLLGSVRLGRAANGVIERLDGVRGQVLETFTDARFTILRSTSSARKKISRSLSEAISRIRKDD